MTTRQAHDDRESDRLRRERVVREVAEFVEMFSPNGGMISAAIVQHFVEGQTGWQPEFEKFRARKAAKQKAIM